MSQWAYAFKMTSVSSEVRVIPFDFKYCLTLTCYKSRHFEQLQFFHLLIQMVEYYFEYQLCSLVLPTLGTRNKYPLIIWPLVERL